MAATHRLVLQQYLLQLRATMQIETLERTEPHHSRLPRDFEQLHAKHWLAYREDPSLDDWPVFIRNNLSKLEQDQLLYLAFDARLTELLVVSNGLREVFERVREALGLATGYEMLLWLGLDICASVKALRMVEELVRERTRMVGSGSSLVVEEAAAMVVLREVRRQAVERARREQSVGVPVVVMVDVVKTSAELGLPSPQHNGHHHHSYDNRIQDWQSVLAQLVELPSLGAVSTSSGLACDVGAGLQMMAATLLAELKKSS